MIENGKNLSGEVEDNALIGPKLSKQEVQSTRILIFKNVNKITLDVSKDKDINKTYKLLNSISLYLDRAYLHKNVTKESFLIKIFMKCCPI